MTTHSSSKVQLIAQIKGKSRSAKTYELSKGMGDAGQAVRIQAESGTVYELQETVTKKGPKGIRARRSGRNLEIYLEGSNQPDAVIEGYYDEAIIEFPKDSLTGITSQGDIGIYVIDEGLRPALTTLAGETMPIVLLDNALLFNGWQWGLAAGAGVGVLEVLRDSGDASGTAAPAPAAPTVQLEASSDNGLSDSDRITSITTPTLSGKGLAGHTITIKNAAGQVVATTQVDANGDWSVATTALPQGLQTLSITQTSPSGQTSQPATIELTITGDLTIVGSVTAGPASDGITLFAYDDQGNELGSAAIQSDGTFSILALTRGSYRGVVLLKAVDSNGAGSNYLDEVTAANKSLGTTLRAMGVAQEGRTQFTINQLDAQLEIHITPVTELAVMKAGVTADAAPTTVAMVDQTHQAVAKVLGVNGIDITAAPVATNSGSFSGADGLSDAEKYGLLLTKLSGLDSLNGGSVAITLTQLAQNINTSGTGAITAEGAAMVDQGRQQALAALKNAPSTAEKTFTTDSTLNRQLLGDVIVQTQNLVGGKLEVSGIALPGSTVSITFPDGSTGSAVANSSGVFTLTSAAVQPTLDIPLKITGADGLTQPAAMTPPAAPVIATGDGKIVSGTGTPGTTVTVKNASGIAIGTALVDVLGQWSFVPSTPLADNVVLSAFAQDSSGNVSGPGAGIVDVDQVSVSLAEAADGYINAAEKASGGINFDIGLPLSAQVGDSVRTVVTLPNGSTLTLVDVLTLADLLAGAITRNLTSAQLGTDGLYSAGISLVTQVGQSAPVRQSFIVDATAPAAPVVSPSNGQIINGTAEVGSFVTVKDGSGNVIGTVGPVGTDGNWTLLPAQPLPDGTVLNATATDVAGNTSPVGSNNVDVDALLITGAIDSVGPQLGLLFDGAVTNDTSPQLAGTLGTALMPGQTLAVYRQLNNGALVKVGSADINGTAWTFQDGTGTGLTAPLADGNYTYQVVVESGGVPVAGLTPSGFFDITVDTAQPAAPATTVPEATAGDAYINAAEKASDAGVPIVTQLAANARVGDVVTTTVTLPDGSTRVLSTTLNLADVQAGSISQLLGQSALATDGAYSVSTTIAFAMNGLVSAPTVNTFTLDTSPPAAGTGALVPLSSSDSGTLGDNNTNVTRPALSGTAEANATVQVTLNGQTYTVTDQGGWTVPVTATLPDGTYTPVIKVTDAAGNSITANGTPFTIDTTAPASPAVALPEAPGRVNGVEALSNGGTPIVVTLPADARVGDTITTVVRNPNGTTTELTHVIQASELPASQGGTATGNGPFTATQTIPSAALTVDGIWTTSTTLTDTAGNTSAPASGTFVLDAVAPAQPSVDLPEATNGVSAAEALSNGGTPIVVTLPGDAGIGDTVTTRVTLPDGSSLTLTTVLTATDIAAGSISQLIPSSALTQDGTWTTSTTVTDLAGNASAPRTGSFVLDTTPPSAPVAALDNVSNSGSLADALTNDNTPTISGTGTNGDTITVTFPSGEVKTAVVAADGTWSVTPTTPLADGVNTITVTATDPAGNVSAPTALPITIDTTVPAAPTAALATVSDTGTLGDSLTNDNTPTLSGTGVVGDTITVKDAAGNVIATAVVDANGNWSATTTTLLDGLNNLSITATDPAGNTGPAVALPITIDTGVPAAPAAVLDPASNSGSLLDGLTNDNTPTISGTGTDGDTITVTFPGGEVKTVPVVNGVWSVAPTNPLLDGLNNISVTATDPAGNTSPATTVPVTIDTTPPAAPLADVAAASDTGKSNTDNVTSDTTPTISGAGATPGDTITLYAPNGTTVLGTTVVAADGSWAITPTTALAEGLSNLTVTATDPAGNTSPATTVPVTIDTTMPIAPTVDDLRTNDSTPVITGTATLGVGETLTVSVNGATYNVTVGLGGVWSLNTGATAPISGTLGTFTNLNRYPVTATVTDAAGNATSDATTSELLYDTAAPSVPTVNPLATNDGTPVLTGTANVLQGEVLTVTVNGATYNVTPTSNGNWRLDTGATTPASGTLGAFVNGTSYPVTATITYGAVVSNDTSTNELRFDTTAPSAPAGDVAAASDTGISATDNITSDTTPTIVGTGTAGDTITLYAPNGTTLLGTAVVDAAGNWSITPTALAQGTSVLQITATDPAGNTSAPGTVSVTIDNTAPAAPVAVLDPSSDTGTLGDGITSDNTPTLSGLGEPDATITIKDAAGKVIATAVVASDGTWSATPTTALPNGLNALSVTATDLAGNVSQPTALPVTIDTTAPGAPAAALASSSDTGIVGDGKTADTTPTLTGTGTPGDTITVKDASGNVIATATVAPDGSWSATAINPLADGVYNLQVTATDPAGNTSAPTTVPVTIDATAPNAPTPDVAAASDTGSSNTDNLTSDTTPTISGTGNAGDTITLYAPNGTTVLGTAVVAANGSWAITPTTALPDGTTSLSVTATDLQGNTSAPGTVSVTIDTTAPAAPAAALDSSSDTGNLGDSKTNDTTPTLSGTGTTGDTITIKDAAGNTVGTALVDADGNWSTDTTTLAEGLNALSVTATDPAGNTSAPTALPITVDTTVAAPVIAPTNGVGAVSGTGEPGAIVTLMNGATVLGTAVVDASGNWSVPLAAAVPDTTLLSATQTDLAGNLSPADTEAVDTSVPVINPTNGVVLTGTGKPGDTIALTLADGTVLRDASGAPLTALVAADGTWTATPGAPVPDGTVVTATASYDADNNPATAPVVRSATDSTTVDALPPPSPVASLALASDSGRVGDGLTNDTQPTLSGAGASPGDTITLYAPDGTTVLGTTVVAADGTWSIPVPTPLSNGTHNFQLTATDPVGNTSAPTTLPVTIDTSAPAAPTVALATSSDSGTLGDGITSDNTPTLSGTGTPGDTITIRDAAGNVIATATVAANGSWSATPTAALPDGLNTLSITATDPAGNTGPATALPITIDTTAPAAPTALLASSSDSGTLGDGITNDTTPTLSGTGTPGDTITIRDAAGNVIATAVVGAGGTWTATPTSALPEGLNTLSITATDPAGNTGPATALPITIDTTGPAAPAAVLAPASDSGKLGDSTTSDTTPTIQGTGFAGDTITIKDAAGTVIATATVAPDGTWSATPTTALPEGVNPLSITATDPAGNTGAATTLPITIDTTAPAAPSAALATSSDTGTLGDGQTSDNTPTLSGTGNPGDTITIKDAAGNVIATALVDANGNWSATTSTLPDGVNNLSVTATDPAGNTSAPTALPIAVDTSIGAISIDASNGIGAITGTGEPGATLTLKDSATGAVIGTVTVAPDGSWSVPLTSALPDGTILSATQVDAAGNTSSPESETINTAIPVLAPSNGTVITGTGKPGNTISVTGTNGAVIGTALVDANGNWSLTPTSPLPDGTVVTATDTSSGLTDTTVVDATPPALPVGDVAASSDTGTSNTDNLTSDTTPTITGSGATPGDTIKLYAPDGTTLLGTSVVDAYGNWAITPTTALSDGVQALKLTASDPLGNTTAPVTLNVTIDTTAPAAPTATLSSASDSGTQGDNITSDTTPTLSGTGEPGATITIKDAAGNVLVTAVVAADGTWSATTSTLPQGENALSITATDAAGNTSAPTALSLTIDTTAPATPAAPDLLATSDSGNTTDNLTNDTTPSIAVTAPPAGGSVVLYVDGVATPATYDATTGTVTPTTPLGSGTYAITYAVVDAAGNASAQSPALSVTIDTAAPAQPAAPDMTAATDSGSSTTDNITVDTTPTFTVTAPPAGGSLVLYVDGVAVAANYDAATGTLTPTVALTDGAHTITYTAVDAAGNVSTASTALAVNIDTVAPDALQPVLYSYKTVSFSSMTKDSSVAAAHADWTTNDASAGRLLSGHLDQPLAAGDTVQVFADGTLIGNAVVYGTEWAITDPNAYNANWTYTAKVVNSSNQAGPVASQVVVLDVASDAAPVITGALDSAQISVGATGTNSSGLGATANTLASVSGTGVAGSTIQLYDNTYTKLVGTAVVGSNGSWTVSGLSGIGNTSHSFLAVQMDSAGNQSASSNLWTVPSLYNGVANGDLSAGNTGFTSSVTYSPTVNFSTVSYSIATVSATPPAVPTLTTNAVTTYANGTWYDKTAPANFAWDGEGLYSGQYFIASLDNLGSSDAPVTVWSQNVSVVQGQTYELSFDYMTQYFKTVADYNSRSGIDVVINGQTIMSTKALSLGQVFITYTATETGSIPIAFKTYGAISGSDLSFDDVTFRPAAAATNLASGIDLSSLAGVTSSSDTLSYAGGVLSTLEGEDSISAGTNLQTLLTAGGMVDGGAGVDTLTLAASTTLNLVSLTSKQTVKSIQEVEVLQLQGSSVLTLNANNVLSLGGTALSGYSFDSSAQTALGAVAATGSTRSTGKVQLVIKGTGTDAVNLSGLALDGVTGAAGAQGNANLTGQWDYKGQVTLNSKTYAVYDHSTTQAQLLVEVGISTTVAAPVVPPVVMPADPTTDATPTISGTGTPGDTIKLYAPDGTTLLATGVVGSNGYWSVTPTASLPNGAQTLQLTATDAAGNVSTAGTLALTITNTPTVFSSGYTASITESNSAQTVNGTLVFSDPDGPTTITPLTAVNGNAGLGKFTINTSGAWSYTMNTAQNAMTAGQVKTDTITVSAADGTTQVLTVTITGTNDQPTSSYDVFYVGLEDDGAPINGTTTGVALNSLGGMGFQRDAEGAPLGFAVVGPVASPTGGAGSTWGNVWYSIDGGANWVNLTAASANLSLTNALILDNSTRFYFEGKPNAPGTLARVPIRLWDGTVAATSGSTADISALTGSTGAYSASNTRFDFELSSVNDAPVNTLPAGPVITSPNTAKVITGLQISDVDAGSLNMTVTLAVGQGSLAVLSGTGVTVTGSGTRSVTLTGTLSSLNTLLATANAVTYTPSTGFLGSDTLTMTTNDNNTVPSNGRQIDTDTLTISVLQEQVAVAITSISTDSGTAGDRITSDKTPTISGTSDKPNRPLTLTIAGVTFSVMTDGSGNWSVDTGALTPTSGTYDKAVGFTDGLKTITVSLSGTQGGTGTASSDVTIDTSAPNVVVTSVFGDAVGAAGNGYFEGPERGFDTATYTLSPTVSPLPIISGTTTAEDGQTVTVTLNGKTYTTTASGGTWSVSVPSADAVLLNHGNTYAITANVSDKAGNAAVADTNNGVLVNIAPPDVPTVVSQTTTSATPTITGMAQKLNGANTVNLVAGDVVTVVVKNATGTTLGTYTLTVGGTSSPAGLSYNTTTGAWSLAVPAGVLTSTLPASYNIEVSATAGGVTRTDISSSELKVVSPPVITSIPEAPTLNVTESTSDGGTPVNVGLTGTGAVAGQVITVNWGGQTFTQVLTQADIDNNAVAIVVPTATLQAETPTNTTETVVVTVSLGAGVTSLPANVDVNFITPATPTINNVAWASTGAASTSSILGIPEAHFDKPTAVMGVTSTYRDNSLTYAEATASTNLGTVLRVQLPTVGAVNPALAGDYVVLTWGTTTIRTAALTSTDISNKYIDITVPLATLEAEPFGQINVGAQIESGTSGNLSGTSPLTVNWAYNLPIGELTSLSAGFAINGMNANEGTGYDNQRSGVVNVGDVNGDGYDDFTITSINGANKYVVYGKPGLDTVELSNLTAPGNSHGFVVSGTTSVNTRGGDVNGDGLSDIIVKQNGTTSWVVYGKTSSPGLFNVSTLGSSDGFKITMADVGTFKHSIVGDVNGDGFDDMLFNLASGNFLLYGGTSSATVALPTSPALGTTYTNGFYIAPASGQASGGVLPTASGDFNGDGYSDFVINNYSTTAKGYVFFGGSALTNIATTTLDTVGNSRGFAISSVSGGSGSYYATNTADVNGDGLDDLIVNETNGSAYVVFGKTDTTAVNLTSLGTNGFFIRGNSAGSIDYISDVDVIGDFNGDGLADLLISDVNLTTEGVKTGGATVVYGRTSSTTVELSAMTPDQGFRIQGFTQSAGSDINLGNMGASAVGDVNGDGFADIAITASTDDPSGRTNAGITRIVFGGVDKLESMTFQALNGDAVGTTGNDTLVGTSGANQIVAGDGNDTLIGAGGADVLYGGRGNDLIEIDASNIAALGTNAGNTSQAVARVDGGTGTDTLQLMASLDLTQVRPAAIQSIERFNLFSSGTSLKMGLMDVIALSEKNNPFNTATGWTASTTGGAVGWGAVNVGAQVVVDGTATNDLYLNNTWVNVGTVENGGKTYKVLESVRGEAQVIVDASVRLHMPPAIMTTANELAGGLNANEAGNGTDVRINLADTDAVAGNTIQLNWGGQVITIEVTSDHLTAGYVDVQVSYSVLTTETPLNTTENVVASVTMIRAGTTLAQSDVQGIAVNFVQPTAPTISAATWTATGAGNTSAMTGIPEAQYSLNWAAPSVSATGTTVPTSGAVDNALYVSEVANNGTVVRVQLPVATGAAVPPVAGDQVVVTWGTATPITVTLVANNITNKYIDVTVPFATLDSQVYGTVPVTAAIVSAVSGNSSPVATLNVNWVFDLPAADITTLSAGFGINGRVASETTGTGVQGVVNLGDVNGDGFDDFSIVGKDNFKYVVYGKPSVNTVELSDLTAAGNTNGFIIAGGTSTQVKVNTRGGDVNGDGFNDILVKHDAYTTYVIYGGSTSPGLITASALAASSGYTITTPNTINSQESYAMSVVGDVNGDGFDDILFNLVPGGNNFVLYGSANSANISLPTLTTATYSNGFFIKADGVASGGQLSTASGDFNGDGYSDFVVNNYIIATGYQKGYVVFGGSGLTSIAATDISAASRGFTITGLTGAVGQSYLANNMGDVNGDGMDDIIVNNGTGAAYVIWGKSDYAAVSVTSLTTGQGGFAITPGSGAYIHDVDVIGDFNGDGLADLLLSDRSTTLQGVAGGAAYVVFGRTENTNMVMTNLAASEGFRITGTSSATEFGGNASAAGDVNGDGFADVVITARLDDPTGRSDAGVTRVIFGGVSDLLEMTFDTAHGDLIGTAASEALTGTSGNNQIVAGDGNDTLTGAGGADVLYGGRGDDTFVLNADNVTQLASNTGNTSQDIARIDGGSGIDTLELDGAGIVLDLTAIRSVAVTGVEHVDITGSGANTVKLSLTDVLQMGDNNVFDVNASAIDSRKQLMVTGDADDKVVLTDLNSWTPQAGSFSANSHTYAVYNHYTANVQLLIDQQISNITAS